MPLCVYSVVRDPKEEGHKTRNGWERLQRKGLLSQGNSMDELGKGYGRIMPVFWVSKSMVLEGTAASSDRDSALRPWYPSSSFP